MTWIVRPVLLFAGLNLLWEVLQLPFYTLWRSGTPGKIAFDLLHCTVGDVLIGISVWAISRLLAGKLAPFRGSDWPLLGCFICLAMAYTVFSEWLNVHVTGNWAYAESMPVVTPLGTGLAPLLQWVIVPLLTWAAAGGPVRSRLAGRPADAGGRAS